MVENTARSTTTTTVIDTYDSNWLGLVLIGTSLFAAGCGPAQDGEDVEQATAERSWECDAAHDGWEQCDGDSVIWCHAVSNEQYDSAHFHEGTNCAEDGAECIALTEQVAACRDPAASCAPGAAECDERTAINCVDGARATMRCSLTEECAVVDGAAMCTPK